MYERKRGNASISLMERLSEVVLGLTERLSVRIVLWKGILKLILAMLIIAITNIASINL